MCDCVGDGGHPAIGWIVGALLALAVIAAFFMWGGNGPGISCKPGYVKLYDICVNGYDPLEKPK